MKAPLKTLTKIKLRKLWHFASHYQESYLIMNGEYSIIAETDISEGWLRGYERTLSIEVGALVLILKIDDAGFSHSERWKVSEDGLIKA